VLYKDKRREQRLNRGNVSGIRSRCDCIFTLPSTRQHRPRRQPHGENASNHILVRQFNIKSAGPADASVLKTRDGFACGRAGKGQEGGVETRGSD